MEIKLLHLNIEKHKHVDKVGRLLETHSPDIVCLVEVVKSDIPALTDGLQYNFVYSPLEPYGDDDSEGSAILSKTYIQDSSEFGYNEKQSESNNRKKDTRSLKGNRPQERFSYNYSVLTALVNVGGGVSLHIATTHFPVFDHSTPGYKDHTFDEIGDVDEWTRIRAYTDRLMSVIKKLQAPLIFTADLNSPRGEYTYNALAHELVDKTPKNIDSTLDPTHRASGLKLVVDAIMTSPDVNIPRVKVIEGVSDHKALLATVLI